MTIAKYHDFLLIADNVQRDERGIRQFTVQVARSPTGGACGQQLAEVRDLDKLQSLSRRLEYRQLQARDLVEFGELLAQLLLPGDVLELLKRNREDLSRQSDQGLRLRLQLAPALFSIPWEYLYVPYTKDGKDRTGFLALDTSLSIVRDQQLLGRSTFDPTPRARRLLLVMANPRGNGLPDLALDQDHAILAEALNVVPGVTLEPLADATLNRLAQKLQEHTDIVHFAGHGVFKQTGCGESFQSVVGEGQVIFATANNTPDPVAADVFARNLAHKGVQLVVLGACETGRTDQENVWSGVVAALMEVGIPAAVAMQFKIRNDNALIFTQSFYQSLAAGHLLDQAIADGRTAIFNRFHANPDHPGWQDWGAPVVYLRQDTDFVLPVAIPAIEKLDQERKEVNPPLEEVTLEWLNDLVVRSGRVDGIFGRRALCKEIGVDTTSLPFLEGTASKDFVVLLLEHLKEIGDLAALRSLCDQIAPTLKGPYANKLAAVRAVLERG